MAAVAAALAAGLLGTKSSTLILDIRTATGSFEPWDDYATAALNGTRKGIQWANMMQNQITQAWNNQNRHDLSQLAASMTSHQKVLEQAMNLAVTWIEAAAVNVAVEKNPEIFALQQTLMILKGELEKAQMEGEIKFFYLRDAMTDLDKFSNDVAVQLHEYVAERRRNIWALGSFYKESRRVDAVNKIIRSQESMQLMNDALWQDRLIRRRTQFRLIQDLQTQRAGQAGHLINTQKQDTRTDILAFNSYLEGMALLADSATVAVKYSFEPDTNEEVNLYSVRLEAELAADLWLISTLRRSTAVRTYQVGYEEVVVGSRGLGVKAAAASVAVNVLSSRLIGLAAGR